MGYEILYKRFLLNNNGMYIPYVIHGSNNCFEPSGKRERCLTNLFKSFENVEWSTLDEFLGMVYDKLSADGSGFLKGIPKTKKGFINGFYNKVVDLDRFVDDAIIMEHILKRHYSKKRKRITAHESAEKLKDKPFKEFKRSDCKKLLGKTIIVFSKNFDKKHLIGRGKIKETYADEYGFFPTGYGRRYIRIGSIDYYKIEK
jgi:hypothetical protein